MCFVSSVCFTSVCRICLPVSDQVCECFLLEQPPSRGSAAAKVNGETAVKKEPNEDSSKKEHSANGSQFSFIVKVKVKIFKPNTDTCPVLFVRQKINDR